MEFVLCTAAQEDVIGTKTQAALTASSIKRSVPQMRGSDEPHGSGSLPGLCHVNKIKLEKAMLRLAKIVDQVASATG